MIEEKEKQILRTRKENEAEALASYHFYAPKGWINDPNGIIFYDGSYKIYFQYNQKENYWNNITIGVASSLDLLKFSDFNVAIEPIGEVNGIFSGSVTSNEKGLHLIFTKHIENEKIRKETISEALSKDGKTFDYDYHEIINERSLPEFDPENFRDPFIYREKDNYYLFVASKDKEENLGKIIVLKSKDLNNFTYIFEIGPLEVFGEMVECPSIGKIGDDYVLLYSYISKSKTGIISHKTGYLILDLDLENESFAILKCGEFDNSKDFYAPQFFATKDNELALISWFNSRDYKPIEQQSGLESCGLFTYPRLVSLDHGFLIQKPYKEIHKHISKQYVYYGKPFKNTSLIKVVASGEFKLSLLSQGYISCEILYYQNKLYFKANNVMDESIFEYNGEIALLLMLDKTSIEIFINKGKETISRRLLPLCDEVSFKLFKEENIKKIVIAELDLND